MREIILLTLMAIGVLPVYSQTAAGVIGGYNLSSILPKRNLESWGYDVTSRSGWRAGLITDHHLWSKFYLQPQLLLNRKGYDYAFLNEVNGSYSKTQRQFLYLELQASLVFKQQLGKGKLIVGAGHYIGRGVTGKERSVGYYLDQYGNRVNTIYHYDIKFKSKEPPNSTFPKDTYVKPYDLGINYLVGYELKNGLFFNVTYSRGLTELGFYNAPGGNTYWGLTIGYFLKRFS